ncbi:MAG: radical SAM protein [Ruminococcaceae bacterium]|nr:radical SAM protein [Oscillospiraceae bacterium]
MNPYLTKLSRMEFVITYACTGRCRHCSEGDHPARGVHIDPETAAEAVRQAASAYPMGTIMTFGGEPMLYPEAVYAIHKAAAESGIPRRQLITNGFFSRDAAKIREAAERLADCGVNDLLLSADAFHQETIPLDIVKQFAEAVRGAGVPIRVQPAWLVSKDADNPYNRRTREILAEFAAMEIRENDGNVIFPSGNALRYLAAYFDPAHPVSNPYEEDPRCPRTISVDPDGSVMGGNLYRQTMAEILASYAPA